MKILVTDDELLARESIIAALNGMGYNDVLEAKDGLEALELIKQYKPNVVIADIRMPKMDGIELLTEVNSLPVSKSIFIFLSGYDLFEYAQKAITLGAFSYLLKPVKKNELENVLAKACKKLELENKRQDITFEMKFKVNQGLNLLRRNFFFKMVTESLSKDDICNQLTDLDIHFVNKNFCVILISIDNYKNLSMNMTLEEDELQKFCIENISSEILADSSITAYPFNIEDGQGILLNYPEVPADASPTFISNPCSKVIENINKFLNLSVVIGIGTTSDKIEDSYISYNAAKKAVMQRLVNNGNQVFIYKDNNNHNEEFGFISLKSEQEFYKCFGKQDLDAAMKIINELYSSFTLSGNIDAEALSKLNFQAVLLIYKFLNHLNINADEILGDEFLLYNQLNLCSNITDILSWFKEKLKICFDAVESSYNKYNLKLIQKVKEYILNNIHKDITLEGAADYVHLSPNYLSKIFKQIEGNTFIGFVTNIRIEKACSLLKEGRYKVNAVSSMVGFNDVKYFYKVFKKVTGFSPTDYKCI